MFTVGKDYSINKRAVYQWEITDNDIPDNSTITSVRLYFTYSHEGHSYQLPAYFYNISYDIVNPDQTQLNGMWDNMNSTSDAIGTITGVNNVIDFVSNNSSASFNQAVRNSLPNNKFVLGIMWTEYSYVDWRTWLIGNETLTLRIEYIPPQKLVTLDQRLSDNSQVGKLRKWEGTEFTPYPYINPGTEFSFPLTSVQTIQGDQSIISNQKYNNWNNDLSNVQNHKSFTISNGTSELRSNFNPTQLGITIKNNLEQTTVTGGNIDFKDPWLIDYADPAYGSSMRNRGMDAPFKPRTAPFCPDATTSYSGDVYKGVFLDQGGTGFTPPYYSVQVPQTQNINLGSPQGTRTFYFQNWNTTNATLQDANALTTGVVFNGATATVSANYKGHLLSNNSTGFSSNSQRKFISDVDGNKHLVYESQGNVWYTKSTNNGSTWQQEVKLNEDGTQAKGATFAYSSGDGYMYILYQCDHGTWGNPNPTLILSQYSNIGTLRWREEVCELSSYAFNTTPTISAVSGVVLVVYRPNATGGLVGKEYWLSSGNVTLIYDRIIPGTTQYSTNPSLATTVLSQPTKHMLVYQESYYGIYYKQWTVATDFGNLVTSNLTSGVGYSLNYTPSIVDVTTGSRLCWVGSNYSGTSKQVVFRDPENLYQFWTFGNSVASPSINKTDANTAYFIGWSDGNGASFKIVDNHLSYSYIKTLTGLQGSAMQLSNGGGANTMYAMTFYNGGLPYPLTQSNSLASYYSMSKENTNSNIASGRAGIVMKGEGEFSFMLGDIEVNSEKIRFKKLSDTLTIPSKDVFNTLVESEPFELKENTSFTYSVEYGVTDSALAAQVLQNGENVKFKVELVDALTNQIINTFDNVTYTKNFLQKYNSLAYQVNTEAIGTMNVKLRLVADHSGDANYLINNSFVEDEIIAKKGFKVINLKNELQIKDYALAQNYPNPFNPVTTITYQLPKSGSVTLKIFDILGNEVKTLVNEQKEMGRYTVQFDASSLASGMYVYQLRANDYTSTKKMMLLK